MSKNRQESHKQHTSTRKRGLTPKGVGPLFSGNPTFRRKIAGDLLDLFKHRGYREISLPAFEYLDALRPGIDPALLEKAYTIQDRNSGHVLILRPDATAQIARLLAHALQSGFDDLRFSYSTTVFRHEDHHILERELFQAGVEYWGNPSIWGDWEVIHLCLQGARKLSIWNPTLVLSHRGLQLGIIDLISKIVPESSPEEIARVFHAHDHRTLEELVHKESDKTFPQKKKKLFLSTLSYLLLNVVSLPQAVDLIKTLTSFLPDHQVDGSFLTFLEEWAHGPEDILFDLSLAPVGPYYTGMFFHLYTPGSTREIASGGRYDKLPQLFGVNIPATGFAFHLNRIDDSTSIGKEGRDHEEVHFFILPSDIGSYHHIERMVSRLTQNGRTVRVLYQEGLSGKDGQQKVSQEYFERFPVVSEVIWQKEGQFISFLRNGSSHIISHPDHE